LSSAIQPVHFPPGFVWGTATAAYQIEGSVDADGRGPSIWDTFSHAPGRTHNGDTGDVACDHYRRLDDDLDLIARLGVGAYRFSVAWPRIQPDGKGPAVQAGLDFYRRLVDGLRTRDVTPVATLYHWDLPQALEDAGGWTERETSSRFAEYAALAAAALGDQVGQWITLNEPWCSAWAGYGKGRHAPGRRDVTAAVAATHHLLLGHGLAVEALRAESRVPVGITLNLAPTRSASADPADVSAAARADGNLNRLFLDPVFRGHYPPDMIEQYPDLCPGSALVAEADAAVIQVPLDFLGVNYYSPHLIADPARLDEARAAGYLVRAHTPDPVDDDLSVAAVGRPDVARTGMDWEIEPGALTELLRWVHEQYAPGPIYVTENGAAFCDYVAPDGAVRDPERIAYLDGHVRAVHDAIAAGVGVQGYFLWSLMDNFEWGYGYAKRFGITWIDYVTGQRIPKASFHWYHQVIDANGIG
jgi:beta-glucosidase